MHMPMPQKPMTPGIEHYKTLEVSKDATADEIKKAYYKKARKTHSNSLVGTGDDEEFKKLSEAYQVLSDVQKRDAYDRNGDEGVKELEHMPRQAAEPLPPPVSINSPVSFEHIMTGKDISVSFQKRVGGAVEHVTTMVYVPKGHASEVPIVLTGQGHENKGDVIVQLMAPKSERQFTRNGCDLVCTITLPLWRVLIGGTIELPVVPGELAPLHVTLPSDRVLKKDDEFELPNHGFPMPHLPGVRGSLIVRLDVDYSIPAHVTRDALLSAAGYLGAPSYTLVPSAFVHTENRLSAVDAASAHRRQEDFQSAVRARLEEHQEHNHQGPVHFMNPFGMMGGGGNVQQVQCAQQ